MFGSRKAVFVVIYWQSGNEYVMVTRSRRKAEKKANATGGVLHYDIPIED